MSKVLVIDDQQIPRKAVATILRESGHEVAEAATGAEGVQLARDFSPDVIVLDVYMPGLDGFEVVERLKSDPATTAAPVIFLTAESPTDELIVRGLALGASDFLNKSCSRAELLARIGVMIRIKRSNDELSAVAKISDTLIQSLDPKEVGQRFVAQLREIFRSRGVLLAFRYEESAPLQLTMQGFEAPDPLVEALARTLEEDLAASRTSQMEFEAAALRGPAGLLARRQGFESILATRVEHGAQPPILVALLGRHSHGSDQMEDAPLLRVLTRQATVAMDNALLHQRTREQARKMSEQAKQLEHAISERSRFFATISHELRTPINAVIGYNQLLHVGAYGEMTAEQNRVVERVSRSAHHLLELINDILDISKIEAGKMQIFLEPTNLAFLIDDTVTSLKIQAEEKGLDLQVHSQPDCIAKTDPARVRQILLNLLSNAVKFTEHGSISVHLIARDASFDIQITDTGPGIRPEDRERIFDEFEQTQTTSNVSGTGLGLAISKRLAHLLGGELFVESEFGAGSTFTLRLPSRWQKQGREG